MMKFYFAFIMSMLILVSAVGCDSGKSSGRTEQAAHNVPPMASTPQKQDIEDDDFITYREGVGVALPNITEEEARQVLYSPWDESWVETSSYTNSKKTAALQYIYYRINRYGCTPEELNDMATAFWYRVNEGLNYSYYNYGIAAANEYPEGITKRRALMQATYGDYGGSLGYIPSMDLYGSVICTEVESYSLCFEDAYIVEGKTQFLEVIWVSPGKVVYSRVTRDDADGAEPSRTEYPLLDAAPATELTDEECVKFIELFIIQEVTNEPWEDILSGYLQRHLAKSGKAAHSSGGSADDTTVAENSSPGNSMLTGDGTSVDIDGPGRLTPDVAAAYLDILHKNEAAIKLPETNQYWTTPYTVSITDIFGDATPELSFFSVDTNHEMNQGNGDYYPFADYDIYAYGDGAMNLLFSITHYQDGTMYHYFTTTDGALYVYRHLEHDSDDNTLNRFTFDGELVLDEVLYEMNAGDESIGNTGFFFDDEVVMSPDSEGIFDYRFLYTGDCSVSEEEYKQHVSSILAMAKEIIFVERYDGSGNVNVLSYTDPTIRYLPESPPIAMSYDDAIAYLESYI